jgi:hypothetical protein
MRAPQMLERYAAESAPSKNDNLGVIMAIDNQGVN